MEHASLRITKVRPLLSSLQTIPLLVPSSAIRPLFLPFFLSLIFISCLFSPLYLFLSLYSPLFRFFTFSRDGLSFRHRTPLDLRHSKWIQHILVRHRRTILPWHPVTSLLVPFAFFLSCQYCNGMAQTEELRSYTG